MFTMRPGTTITLATVMPSRYFWLCSDSSAAFSMVSFVASAGKSRVKRVLPLKEMPSVTVSSLSSDSSKAGHAASHTVVS